MRRVLLLLLLAGCSRGELARARKHPKFDAHLHLAPGMTPDAAALMRRENVVGGINLSGGWAGMGLEQQLDAAARVPDVKLVVFANLDFRGIGAPGWAERQVQQLERARALGARGLKIYKQLGLGHRDEKGALLRVDDARLDPIWSACGRLGFPVAIHTGDPKAFFQPDTPQNERHAELAAHPRWSFARPGYPSWEELFGEYEAVVKRHPETRFIGVHFGNDPEEPARVGAMLDRYPNLYIDTAARVGEIGRQEPGALRALFEQHADRILFGTDWAVTSDGMTLGASNGHLETVEDLDRFFARHAEFFETDHRRMAHPVPIQGAWTVDAIDLPPEVLNKLYVGNAERLFGLQLPREVRPP